MDFDFLRRFQENTVRLADRPAFQYLSEEKQEVFTFAETGREVARLTTFLHSREIGPGTTVGILMENHPRWGIAFLAVQSAGGCIVPFDILHSAETLAGLIEHSECGFLICSGTLLSKLKKILPLLKSPIPILIDGTSKEGYFQWDEVLEEFEDSDISGTAEENWDEPFVILYTSGTTGNPKGVILTRRALYRNVMAVLEVIRVTPDDHILSVLPLYHILALMVNFLVPLYAGAPVSYLDSLEPQTILKSFQEQKATIFVCVPQFFYLVHRRILQEVKKQSLLRRFLFKRLLSVSHFCNQHLGWNPGRIFFSKIHARFGSAFRLFGVGGARFDPLVARSLTDLGFTMVQAYGMTETAALTTLTVGEPAGAGSAGHPLPHVKLRINRPDDDGIGEVLIQGENVMTSYWKNPEATAEILQDGWLHSGDLGYMDSAGYLHITGRQKDVIVLSSGKNISPEELEHFYQSNCKYIKEICVLGIQDQATSEHQERLHAVIVPDFEYMRSEQTANSHEVIRYMIETLSQRLPSYKRVHSLEIRKDPLPRTTTRKIKRFQVQQELGAPPDPVTAARSEETSSPDSPVEEKIFTLIGEMKSFPSINLDMNLELDLGFDSLERVELSSTIQEVFGIHIPDEATAQVLTVGDLVETVTTRLSGDPSQTAEARLSWNEILQEPLSAEDRARVDKILRPRPIIDLAYYLTAKLVHLVTLVLFRLRVKGLDRLPRDYPYLICPNHLSFIDAFVLVAPLPYRMVKRIFFLGYADYFNRPLLSFLGGLVRVIPVDANKHLRQALRLGAEGLRRGYVLGVFPEGNRSIDGSLKAFRKGSAILAKEIGVPVIPTAIIGSFEVWRRGDGRIRLHPVEVHFGDPLEEPRREDTYESVNSRLFEAVSQLIERARRS